MLVAADDRIARFRHPIPTARRIERTVMAAVCAQRRGLTVSITRLVRFGGIDDDLRRRHDAVCAVDAALHDATRPGARWCDALRAATDAYAAAGYADEWKLHHQGGPMGYELRDFTATPTETRRVQPDQLVGWNPSITGTKSEDTILSGGEILTAMDDWPACGERPDILVRSAP
jgi:antitoxin VapB